MRGALTLICSTAIDMQPAEACPAGVFGSPAWQLTVSNSIFLFLFCQIKIKCPFKVFKLSNVASGTVKSETNAANKVEADCLNWNKRRALASRQVFICQEPPRWARKWSASTRTRHVYAREQPPPICPPDGCYGNQPPPHWCSTRQQWRERALRLCLPFSSCSNQPSDSSSPGCHHHPANYPTRQQFAVPTSWATLLESISFSWDDGLHSLLSPADRSCTLARCGGTATYVTRLPAATPRVPARASWTLWGVCTAIFMISPLRRVSACVSVSRWSGWCTGSCLPCSPRRRRPRTCSYHGESGAAPRWNPHLVMSDMHDLYWVHSRMHLLMVFLVQLSAHTFSIFPS